MSCPPAVRAAGFLIAGGGPTPAVLTGAASAPFVDGDLIRLALDGGGGDVDAEFNGSAAAVAAGASGPYIFTEGMTLTLRIDGGIEQTVVFSAAGVGDTPGATEAEVAAPTRTVSRPRYAPRRTARRAPSTCSSWRTVPTAKRSRTSR